jgi:hypothetical protein
LNPDQKQAKTSFLKLKKQIEEVGTAFLLELGRHYEIRPHSRPQIFLGRKYFYFYRAFLQCCGTGSGIRCLFDPWILESGMGRKSASIIAKFHTTGLLSLPQSEIRAGNLLVDSGHLQGERIGGRPHKRYRKARRHRCVVDRALQKNPIWLMTMAKYYLKQLSL